MSTLIRNVHHMHISHHIVFNIFPFVNGSLWLMWRIMETVLIFAPFFILLKTKIAYGFFKKWRTFWRWLKENSTLSCALSPEGRLHKKDVPKFLCLCAHYILVKCQNLHRHSCFDKHQSSVWPNWKAAKSTSWSCLEWKYLVSCFLECGRMHWQASDAWRRVKVHNKSVISQIYLGLEFCWSFH